MNSEALLGTGVLLGLVAAGCGYLRRTASSEWRRNALSVTMVVIGLVAAFFLFFGAGTLMREMRGQPKPQSQLSVRRVPSPRMERLRVSADKTLTVPSREEFLAAAGRLRLGHACATCESQPYPNSRELGCDRA